MESRSWLSKLNLPVLTMANKKALALGERVQMQHRYMQFSLCYYVIIACMYYCYLAFSSYNILHLVLAQRYFCVTLVTNWPNTHSNISSLPILFLSLLPQGRSVWQGDSSPRRARPPRSGVRVADSVQGVRVLHPHRTFGDRVRTDGKNEFSYFFVV